MQQRSEERLDVVLDVVDVVDVAVAVVVNVCVGVAALISLDQRDQAAPNSKELM